MACVASVACGVGACVILSTRGRGLITAGRCVSPTPDRVRESVPYAALDLPQIDQTNDAARLALEIDEDDFDNSNYIEMNSPRSCSQSQASANERSPSGMGSLPCTPPSCGWVPVPNNRRAKHFRMSVSGETLDDASCVASTAHLAGPRRYRLSVSGVESSLASCTLPQGAPDEPEDGNLEDMYDFDPATVASLNAVANLNLVVDRLQSTRDDDDDDMYDFDPVTVANLSAVANLNSVVDQLQGHIGGPCQFVLDEKTQKPTSSGKNSPSKQSASHCEFDFRLNGDVLVSHQSVQNIAAYGSA